MEVGPTSGGEEDDGVIWFRCPQCQGFLPKLGGIESDSEKDAASSSGDSSPVAGETAESSESSDSTDTADSGEALPWDSPADMMAAREKSPDDPSPTGPTDPKGRGKDEPAEPSEPVHEYAALLAEKDQSQPTPYRPWETYDVGQCIHHQAWEDCGVVVAKEDLPGGRQIIKCYFEEAGVVRLIEQAPK